MKPMNYLATATSLLFVLSSAAHAQGTGAGNGGDVVICKAGDAVRVETLDRFEMRFTAPATEPLLGGTELDEYQKAKIVLDRMSYFSPSLHTEYLARLAAFRTDVHFADIPLSDIPDSGNTTIPENCEVKQAAIRIPSRIPYGKLYYFYKPYWDLLDTDNRAVLITHEIIFGVEKDHGAENSIDSRAINRSLISNAESYWSPQAIKDWVIQHKMDDFITFWCTAGPSNWACSPPATYSNGVWARKEIKAEDATVKIDGLGTLPILPGIYDLLESGIPKNPRVAENSSFPSFSQSFAGGSIQLDIAFHPNSTIQLSPNGRLQSLAIESIHSFKVHFQDQDGTVWDIGSDHPDWIPDSAPYAMATIDTFHTDPWLSFATHFEATKTDASANRITYSKSDLDKITFQDARLNRILTFEGTRSWPSDHHILLTPQSKIDLPLKNGFISAILATKLDFSWDLKSFVIYRESDAWNPVVIGRSKCVDGNSFANPTSFNWDTSSWASQAMAWEPNDYQYTIESSALKAPGSVFGVNAASRYFPSDYYESLASNCLLSSRNITSNDLWLSGTFAGDISISGSGNGYFGGRWFSSEASFRFDNDSRAYTSDGFVDFEIKWVRTPKISWKKLDYGQVQKITFITTTPFKLPKRYIEDKILKSKPMIALLSAGREEVKIPAKRAVVIQFSQVENRFKITAISKAPKESE